MKRVGLGELNYAANVGGAPPPTGSSPTRTDARTRTGHGRRALRAVKVPIRAGVDSADPWPLIDAIDDYAEKLTGDRGTLHAQTHSIGGMKYAEPRPYADPEKAACRLLEHDRVSSQSRTAASISRNSTRLSCSVTRRPGRISGEPSFGVEIKTRARAGSTESAACPLHESKGLTGPRWYTKIQR